MIREYRTNIVGGASSGSMPTGPVRFDDDWPGLFVRGDEVGTLLAALREYAGVRPGSLDECETPEARMRLLEATSARRMRELVEATQIK
jgi:hypothetical protein